MNPGQFLGSDLSDLYTTRFSVFERVRKEELWETLCRHFLQQFIPENAIILDVGSGSCEFINEIRAKKKYALDLNPITRKMAGADVTVLTKSAEEIDELFRNQLDAIFMSNFLEHLENKLAVYRLLKKSRTALKPGGKLLIMQPDIKRVGNKYWDFFDHSVPLTQRSLSEAIVSAGLSIKKVIAPFLPYTTNTWWLPQSSFLLRIYLRLRPLQLLFGKQFFLVAEKPRPKVSPNL